MLVGANLAPGDVLTFRWMYGGSSGTVFQALDVTPTITIPAADSAPTGTTTYFFSNTASDLTGATVNKQLVTSGAASGTWAPTCTAIDGDVADSVIDASFFVPSGIPGTAGSANSGKYSTVSISITTGNTNLRYAARLVRVNSSGVAQAWGPLSAETSSGATATYTFNASWFGLGTWASGDRLRLDIRVRNTVNTASQTFTLTFDANSKISFIDTAGATYNDSVSLAVALVIGPDTGTARTSAPSAAISTSTSIGTTTGTTRVSEPSATLAVATASTPLGSLLMNAASSLAIATAISTAGSGIPYQASAALAVTAAIAAAGLALMPASGSLTFASAIIAAANALMSASGSLAVATAINPTTGTTRVSFPTATLSIATAINPAGSIQALPSAALNVSPAIAAAGGLSFLSTATLSFSPAITPASLLNIPATATMAFSPAIIPLGSISSIKTATLAFTSAIAPTGNLLMNASGSLGLASGLAAAAGFTFLGLATLSAATNSTASGNLSEQAAAALAVSASLLSSVPSFSATSAAATAFSSGISPAGILNGNAQSSLGVNSGIGPNGTFSANLNAALALVSGIATAGNYSANVSASLAATAGIDAIAGISSVQTAALAVSVAIAAPMGGYGTAPAFEVDFKSITSLPSWLSHSRGTHAMVTDSTGKLTYAPNNLITNSSDPSTWTNSGGISYTTAHADPDGGTNAWELTFTGASQEFYTWVPIPIGVNSLATGWIKGTAGETICWNPIDPTSARQLITLTGSWQQIAINIVPGRPNVNTYWDLSTFNDAGGTPPTARVIQIYKPVIAQVTYETAARPADQVFTSGSPYYGPRFDHKWNGSAWVASGLRDEEQRENRHKSSGDLMASGWTVTRSTRALSSTLSPDGNLFMTELTAEAGTYGGAGFYYSNGFPYTANTVGTLSWYFKKNNHNYVWLTLDADATGAWASAIFDLSTGLLTQSAHGAGGTFKSAELEDVGNGIYRAKLTASHNGTEGYGLIGFAPTPTGNTFDQWGSADVAGMAGTEKFLAWGADFEEGDFATSYIPTTTAAVMRNADNMNADAIASSIGPAGTVVAEWQTMGIGADGAATAFLSQSADGKQVVGLRIATNGYLYAFARNASLAVAGYLEAGWTNGSVVRQGLSWDASGSSASYNGDLYTDPTAMEQSATSISIGHAGSGSQNLNGWYGALAIYSSRLPNADLQSVSTIGAPFSFGVSGGNLVMNAAASLAVAQAIAPVGLADYHGDASFTFSPIIQATTGGALYTGLATVSFAPTSAASGKLDAAALASIAAATGLSASSIETILASATLALVGASSPSASNLMNASASLSGVFAEQALVTARDFADAIALAASAALISAGRLDAAGAASLSAALSELTQSAAAMQALGSLSSAMAANIAGGLSLAQNVALSASVGSTIDGRTTVNGSIGLAASAGSTANLNLGAAGQLSFSATYDLEPGNVLDGSNAVTIATRLIIGALLTADKPLAEVLSVKGIWQGSFDLAGIYLDTAPLAGVVQITVRLGGRVTERPLLEGVVQTIERLRGRA